MQQMENPPQKHLYGLAALPPDAAVTQQRIYASRLGELLHIPICFSQVDPHQAALAKKAAVDCDLLLLVEPPQPWWRRLLFGQPACQLIDQQEHSCLVLRQPRWPIRSLLLILRGHSSDQPAIKWAEKIAQAAQATIRLLPIIPPHPAIHRRGSSQYMGPEMMLLPHTPIGEQLAQLQSRLAVNGIVGQLAHQQGEPDEQIRREVRQTGPDLILIAAEPFSRWQRWWLGELVRPLLNSVDRPLLVAR